MNRRGETALHLSAKRGHVMTVELLVGAGAKLHVRDKGGLTPQRAAEVERQDDTVGVLSRVKGMLMHALRVEIAFECMCKCPGSRVYFLLLIW